MKVIEKVLSQDNLNNAFKQVVNNKGASGIDNITCDEVKDYLKENKDKLISQILNREYQPLPVKRVEIPKPNGGVRKLGIPKHIQVKTIPIFFKYYPSLNKQKCLFYLYLNYTLFWKRLQFC